jgi:branched-chain amino acid transport system permease protein
MAVEAAPVRRTGLATSCRDAALVAAVILVLAVPIVGFQTVGTGGTLAVHLHFQTVGALALAGFAIRLLAGIVGGWAASSGVSAGLGAAAGRITAPLAGSGFWFGLAGLAGAVILPFVAGRDYIYLGATVLTYVMLGWGLNIVVGLAGLLDLGYVAFFAVGAYTVGLLATYFDFSFWACLPLAGLFAGCFGLILGFPVLRLRGDYLAIVTLGFGEIIRIVLLNWAKVTNGPNGIGGIPAPSFFGLPFTRNAPEGATSFADFFGLDYESSQLLIFLYFVILGLALLTNFFTLRLRRLPVGRAWEALREDEIACRAIGINATTVKLSAFAIGAMFGGLAGAFFAAHLNFISPESFTFNESAMILASVVLGGQGSQLGVALAAAALALLPELTRDVVPPEYRLLLVGAAMVLVMRVRPRGLLAHRSPSILLHAKARR